MKKDGITKLIELAEKRCKQKGHQLLGNEIDLILKELDEIKRSRPIKEKVKDFFKELKEGFFPYGF